MSMLINPFWLEVTVPAVGETELVNGDFEEGPSQTAWTLSGSMYIGTTMAGLGDAIGTYSLFEQGTAYQDVSLTSEEIATSKTIEASVEYSVRTDEFDSVTASLEVYDASDTLLETFTDGPITTDNLTRTRLFSNPIDPDATRLRVKFETANNSGSEGRARIDSVALSREILEDAVALRFGHAYAITGHSDIAVAVRSLVAYAIVKP